MTTKKSDADVKINKIKVGKPRGKKKGKGAADEAKDATPATAADAAAKSPEEIEKDKAAASKAAADKKKPEKRPDLLSTTYEPLFVKFSDEEAKAAGLSLAQIDEQIESTRERLASYSGQLRVDIKKLEAERKALAGRIRSGGELRDVKVETLADFKRGSAKLVRLDTMELVRERELHSSERQMSLPIEDGAVTGKKKDAASTGAAGADKKEPTLADAAQMTVGDATSKSMQKLLASDDPKDAKAKEELRNKLEHEADKIVGSDVDGKKPAKDASKKRSNKEGEAALPFNRKRKQRAA